MKPEQHTTAIPIPSPIPQSNCARKFNNNRKAWSQTSCEVMWGYIDTYLWEWQYTCAHVHVCKCMHVLKHMQALRYLKPRPLPVKETQYRQSSWVDENYSTLHAHNTYKSITIWLHPELDNCLHPPLQMIFYSAKERTERAWLTL